MGGILSGVLIGLGKGIIENAQMKREERLRELDQANLLARDATQQAFQSGESAKDRAFRMEQEAKRQDFEKGILGDKALIDQTAAEAQREYQREEKSADRALKREELGVQRKTNEVTRASADAQRAFTNTIATENLRLSQERLALDAKKAQDAAQASASATEGKSFESAFKFAAESAARSRPNATPLEVDNETYRKLARMRPEDYQVRVTPAGERVEGTKWLGLKDNKVPTPEIVELVPLNAKAAKHAGIPFDEKAAASFRSEGQQTAQGAAENVALGSAPRTPEKTNVKTPPMPEALQKVLADPAVKGWDYDARKGWLLHLIDGRTIPVGEKVAE